MTHAKIYKALIITLALSLALAACSAPVTPAVEDNPVEDPPVQPTGTPAAQPTDPPKPADGGAKVQQSQLQRDLAPQVPPGDAVELAEGNAAFAFDFYQAIRESEGNLFYSPHSISVALAMTYAGAKGETAAQMAETLNFSLPGERLHPAFNALDLDLAGRSDDFPADSETQPFQLNIANSLWGQEGYPFLDSFLDVLALNYGAGMRLVDYAGDAEGARQRINDWVEEETQGKIVDLIPAGALGPLTRLVLANAIYFKADWQIPFENELTREMPFNTLDGDPVQAEMMSHEDPLHLRYMAGDGYQAVELPYIGDTASMLVIVPDEGAFSEFEASLDAEQVSVILADLEPKMVDLILPKFSFESEYALKLVLAEMGMPAAFDGGQADFSGMDGTKELFIGDVFHKAFVAVDEKGTEAAAATAVVMKLSAVLMPDLQLLVDRPFIFIIRDRPSEAILFVGRVVSP